MMIIMVRLAESTQNYGNMLYFQSFCGIKVLLRYGCFKRIQDVFTSPSFMVIE